MTEATNEQIEYGVLVANWNGSACIERCLHTVLTAARRTGRGMRVLVVDDASTDDSPEILGRFGAVIDVLALERNVGFAEAVNRGMSALGTPWVFLLNNDLALPADYFERLIAARAEFDAEARPPGDAHSGTAKVPGPLFAIGAQTIDWSDGRPNHGGMRAAWRGGMIVQEPFDSDRLCAADFFQAGACLIDRRAFIALGAFAGIYHPGYWEDYDLAWRAARAGMRIAYEPRAVAYHAGKQSMSALLGSERLALTIKRNHLLFNWANLRNPGLLAAHLLGLGRLVLAGGGRDEPISASWGRAFLAALARLGAVLRCRRARRASGSDPMPAPIGDREILHLR